MKLTTRSVTALRPRSARYWVNDDSLSGFRIAVLPSGVKSFAVRLRSRGGRKNRRDSMHVIGRFGSLTADQARERAKELLSRTTLGEDLAAAQRETRSAQSIREIAEEFLVKREGKLKPTTLYEYRRLLTVEILPTLGARPAKEVSRRDVAQLHYAARKRPYLANRIVAVLGSLFTWAEKQGYIPEGTHPTAGIELFREESRERYLTDEETMRLGMALREAEQKGLPLHPTRAAYLARRKGPAKRKSHPRLTPANPFAVAALRFLLLSGWRTEEVLSLRWNTVDMERGRVRLSDTKTDLSWRDIGQAAHQLLRDIPRIDGSPHVFPGQNGKAPLASVRHLWYAVRHAAGLGGVRVHDLRHNYTSQGAQRGLPLLILGAIAGHRRIETTKKYAHLGESPVKRAADEISAGIAAQLEGRQTPVLQLRSKTSGSRGRATRPRRA